MEICISPKRIVKILVVATAVLGFLSLFTGYFRMGIASVFNVGAELNVPTWFSSFMLLACSALLAIIAAGERRANRRYALHWTALSVIFLLLSVDEVSALHERLGGIVQSTFKSGIVHELAWTGLAAVFVAFFALVFVKFVLHLPARTRRLFILSAVWYLGGALALEAAGGMWRTAHGDGNKVYTLLMTSEECLGEMLGLTVFIYALAIYIEENVGTVSLSFWGKPRGSLPISSPVPPVSKVSDDAPEKTVHN